VNNKIPPPIVAIVAALLMVTVSILLPEAQFTLPYFDILSALFTALAVSISLLIMAAGVWEFKRASTTVNPLKPDTASELVSSGIFQYSRNPMYLGMTGILIGIFFSLSNLASALVIPLFISFIYQFQIKPEEQAMKKLFTSSFDEYCGRVRRWI
jgi:protein-S-isoprenylcysteine O-methyltransferase Ste14